MLLLFLLHLLFRIPRDFPLLLLLTLPFSLSLLALLFHSSFHIASKTVFLFIYLNSADILFLLWIL